MDKYYALKIVALQVFNPEERRGKSQDLEGTIVAWLFDCCLFYCWLFWRLHYWHGLSSLPSHHITQLVVCFIFHLGLHTVSVPLISFGPNISSDHLTLDICHRWLWLLFPSHSFRVQGCAVQWTAQCSEVNCSILKCTDVLQSVSLAGLLAHFHIRAVGDIRNKERWSEPF